MLRNVILSSNQEKNRKTGKTGKWRWVEEGKGESSPQFVNPVKLKDGEYSLTLYFINTFGGPDIFMNTKHANQEECNLHFLLKAKIQMLDRSFKRCQKKQLLQVQTGENT